MMNNQNFQSAMGLGFSLGKLDFPGFSLPLGNDKTKVNENNKENENPGKKKFKGKKPFQPKQNEGQNDEDQNFDAGDYENTDENPLGLLKPSKKIRKKTFAKLKKNNETRKTDGKGPNNFLRNKGGPKGSEKGKKTNLFK